MEYILQLETLDDITSIRSRIQMVMSKMKQPVMAGETMGQPTYRLLLVVPRDNLALQSLVNMKLLARLMRGKMVELALVTDQPTVRDYARQVRLKVFGSVRAAKRANWISEDAPIAMPNQTLPPVFAPQPPTTDGDQNGSSVRLSQKPSRRKRYKVVTGEGRVGYGQQIVALILTACLAIAFVLAVVGLLPQASVTLIPVAKPLTTDLTVKGDPAAKAVNFSNLTFPARVAQVELSLAGEIDTVEAEFAPAGFASGNVTLINRTDVYHSIPPSTTLTTGSGAAVEFTTRITAELTPQIGATTIVPVVATEAGPIGNVGPGQISRFANPTYDVNVRVINEFGFGGGTYELTNIVVNDDKERLRIHLIDKMKRQGLKQLEEALGEQEFISADTVQVIPLALTFNQFAGDFSETFSGEMQAVVRGTVVGGYNANRLALAGLEAQVPAGFELAAKGLHFGAGEVLEAREGVVIFRIVASGLAVPVIEPHQVAQDIAWLPIGEAQQKLSQRYNLATVPGVELEPAWLMDQLGRLPFAPLRINVEVKEAVTLLSDEEK